MTLSLSDPKEQAEYLRTFATALAVAPDSLGSNSFESESGDAEVASESLLLESGDGAVRIEARFADERLCVSFTDLQTLPGFSDQERALSQAYCASMTREFIPSIEPMSRRLRFQRTILLDDSTPPTAEALASSLSAAVSVWYDGKQEGAQEGAGAQVAGGAAEPVGVRV